MHKCKTWNPQALISKCFVGSQTFPLVALGITSLALKLNSLILVLYVSFYVAHMFSHSGV